MKYLVEYNSLNNYLKYLINNIKILLIRIDFLYFFNYFFNYY